MSEIRKFIDQAIQQNKIVMFSKTYCGFCARAKQLLKQYGAEFEVFELDVRGDGSQIQNELASKTGQRTVPNIFIKQQHIGGCSELVSLDQKGGLKPLLA